MSRRIALVAEGITDFVVIEAALKAILPEPFILIQLQPEATTPKLGGGWGGVVKWCIQYSRDGVADLSSHPLLGIGGFDAIILHIDADVAAFRYEDISVVPKTSWPALPCDSPCPPPRGSVEAVQARVLSWLVMTSLGDRGIFCVPSKATEAWIAAALFGDDSKVRRGIECLRDPEGYLANKPKGKRIKKSRKEYEAKAPLLRSQWSRVETLCSQARVFSDRVRATMP
jgi:hypothetical protein